MKRFLPFVLCAVLGLAIAGPGGYGGGPGGLPQAIGLDSLNTNHLVINTSFSWPATLDAVFDSLTSRTFVLEYVRPNVGYGYGLDIGGDFTGRAAEKTYLVNVSGSRPVDSTMTGDSRDRLYSGTYSNYAVNDAASIVHGIGINVRNRAAAVMALMKAGEFGVKNDGASTSLYGITSTIENYGTVSDLICGILVDLRNEGATATAEYGIHVTNTNNSLGTAADAALYIDDSGANTGWDYGVDMTAATIGTAEIRGQNDETIDNAVDGTWDLNGATLRVNGGTIYNPANIMRLIPVIGKGWVSFNNSTSTLTIRQDSTLTPGAANITLTMTEEDGTAHSLYWNDASSLFQTAEAFTAAAISGTTGIFSSYATFVSGAAAIQNAGTPQGAPTYSLRSDYTQALCGTTGTLLGYSTVSTVTGSPVYVIPNCLIGLFDLVQNSAFAAATGWTTTAGWSIAGGKATHSSGTTTLSQAVATCPIKASETYELVFDVLDYPSGAGTLAISCGGTAVLAATNTLNGRYRYTFVPVNATGDLTFTPSTDWTGSLDNVYLWRQAGSLVVGGGWWTRSNTVTSTYQVLTAGNCVTLNAGSDQVVTLPAISTMMNVYQQTGQRMRFYDAGAGHMILTAAAADTAANVLRGGDTLHVDQYAGVEIQAVPDLGIFAVLR